MTMAAGKLFNVDLDLVGALTTEATKKVEQGQSMKFQIVQCRNQTVHKCCAKHVSMDTSLI